MKRFTSILLAVTMLITLVPTFALAENTETIDYLALTEEEIKNLSAEEYAEWKNQKGLSSQVSLFSSELSTQSFNSGYIRNDYIEAFVGNDGKYTMGTTGGNPDSNTDNNKLLLFGHPSPWSSETLIQIDGEDYFFSSNDNVFSNDGKKCTSTATIDGVTIKQILTLQNNAYTQRADVIEIKYEITNNSGSSKNIGGRIMLDTMLGDNDGAPFKIPGIGDVTTEAQYVGDQIPQYWQSFDNLTNPSVISSGTFYKTLAQRPDMVQFAYWGDISGSDWDYRVDSNQSLTGDSAVAAYYNPTTVANGATKSFATYYGLSDFSFGDITGEVAMQVSAPTALEKNAEGTAYNDNPFTVTAYVTNQTADTINDLSVTLNIPSEFVLGEGVSATKQTGTITTGQEKLISWQVWAKPQSNRKTINYSISASGSGINKNIPMTMTLPAVSYYDVSGISLNKTHLSLQKGKSEKLIAYLNTQNGRQEARKYEVRWSSSDPSVAKVAADGTITTLKTGTTRIKAITADYTKSASCSLTVISRPTTELDLWGLSEIVYKNLDSHVGKTFDQIFKKGNDGKTTGLYNKNTKFYDGTITKNEYFLTELGGFKVEDTDSDYNSGFYGAAFLDCNDGIVISYRGSIGMDAIFSDTEEWLKDWIAADGGFLVFDTLSPQFYQAWDFYRIVREKYPNKKIRLTGHSLGGALAAFVSIMEDEEAITFNGAEGLIIDLAYYMNAYYVDKFNGIDNWKFKNHYVKDDIVGNQNFEIYRTLAHNNNGKTDSAHSLATLIKSDSNGKIQLTDSYESRNYLYSEWTRNLLSWDFYMVQRPEFTNLGISLSKLKSDSGRVLLGTANSYLKTLTAPGNWVEIRDNVFFSGGNTTMTGNAGAPDTFVFKNGDEMIGKGDDDTYITYATGAISANISDPSGNDKIVFKNRSMSELTQDVWDDEDIYRINTGGGSQIWVNKNRNWFQPEIKIVDKNGTERNISSLPIRNHNGNSARMMTAEVSLMSLGDEPIGDATPTSVYITGKNVEFDVLDADKNILGSFDNKTTENYLNDFAYVYTSSQNGSENVEIELINNAKFIRIKAGEDISVNLCRGEIGTAEFSCYTFGVDITESIPALINCKLDSENNFVYENGETTTDISVTELEKVSSIIPTLAGSASMFSLRSNTVESIDLHTGESIGIELSFEPENIAIDDVSVELIGESDIVAISYADNKIVVRGKKAGTDILKITALDGSETSVTIPVTIQQDSLENVTLTSNGSAYVAGTWSEHPVIITPTLPESYDQMVYSIDGTISYGDSVTVDADGISTVQVYAKNTDTGRTTETKTYEIKIDASAPTLSNIENDGDYYIDTYITVSDSNLDAVTVNGTEFTEDEYRNGKWVNEIGSYEIVAIDFSGKTTEIAFEIKALPNIDTLTLDEAELVESIRNAFEDVKYDLPEGRMETLDASIYELESKLSYLNNPDNAENSILGFSIDGQIGEAYINDDLSAILIEVSPSALSSTQTATISISDGANISPKPYVAQDFNNSVTYTVTAANGTERTWTVTASLPADTTAPEIVGATALGNTITLEFDDYIGSILNENGFTLAKANRVIQNNEVNAVTYSDNIVNVEFVNNFDGLEQGEYILSIAAESLTNVSSVNNNALTYNFTLGSVEKVATPTADKSGEVTSGTQITLSTTTDGATIYYTLDGTEPTLSSTVYSAPISITSALTLKAIAIKDGMSDSDVLSVSYTIKTTQTGGGGGGGSSSQTVNVNIGGKDVKATISGSTLTISKIDTATLDKNAVIDLSSLGKAIQTVKLPADAIKAISENGELEIKMTDGSVKFDNKALSAISKELGNNQFSLRIAKVTSSVLNSKQKAIVKSLKDASLYDLELKSGNKIISDFADGVANISINLSKEIDGNIVINHVADDGTLTKVTAEYDKATGIVTATLTHFSKYAITFEESATSDNKEPEYTNVFTDVKSDDWFFESVMKAYENKLMLGTTDTTFAPNEKVTRAMFVTVLHRLSGDTKDTKDIAFSDVKTDAYYAKAVAWAKRNEIVNGVSETEFAPDQEITREQMATILYRYAKSLGVDTTVDEDTNIFSYADSNMISEYAISAIQWAASAEIMKGNSDGTFAPLNSATRAELATVFVRIAELLK